VKILGLHHVAFAHATDAPTLDALSQLLGLKPGHLEEGAGFVERMIPIGPGSVCLQTLESTGYGIVERFLDRRGPGLHHVAFEVDDLDKALEELHSAETRLVDARPRPGGGGTRIAFIHPATFGGLLVELVEKLGSR
jgi:methylmalonyl-CoA epimerase